MNKLSLIALLFLIPLISCGPNDQPQKFQLQGPALGTTYGITYIASSALLETQAIDSLLYAVNQSMSTYWPESDISKINRGASEIEVEPMFQEVFHLSYEVYKRSDGYFDPTVGPLVNAWGFGPEEAILEMTSSRVDSLMTYVGFNQVSLQGNRIEKAHPNIYFDFNAIAKGYTIDRLAVLLDRLGVTDYLIELGGELVAKGENSVGKKQWLVGIDHPENEDRTAPIVLVELKDKALASSGNYRKFRIDSLSGQKFVHTINPLTGYTQNSTTLAASVIAPNCALADAYATAFMAMGYEKSTQLVASLEGIDVFLVYVDPKTGVLAQYMSPGFEAVVFNKTP
ncbi:MAG: FAD:protein FMN transferase [Flavobacteriia bacterium]|nr:FAD:protein FMN transferase [Flavobacteriia bacterium]